MKPGKNRNLPIPTDRDLRWRLLARLIREWHGAGVADGHTTNEMDECERRLGLKLPVALREWYLLAEQRDDVWRQQDSFVLRRI